MSSIVEPRAAKELEELLDAISLMAVKFVSSGEKSSKVVDLVPATELSSILSLQFPRRGMARDVTLEQLQTIQNILDHSVNPWGRRFLDKLYTCTNPIGVISELLLGLLNANSHVYKTSPALTIVEVETARRLAELYGFGQGSGGLTMPGGSASNRLALITAINNLLPIARTTGLAALPSRPVIFTSSHSHYSIDQAACTAGLGMNNVRKVATDTSGRMLLGDLRNKLEDARQRDELPIFINATAGTTVTGAFDPIRDIAALAKEYNCWLHVDGSWGGAVIFSEKNRHRLDGVDLADSVTMNPHKLLAVPLQCSFLLLKQRERLRVNNLGAAYLFHGEDWDLGDGTTGCGRRPDALKMFLAWQAIGSEGFGKSIDDALNHSVRLAALIENHPNLELVLENDPTAPRLQVCFRYRPYPNFIPRFDVERMSRRMTPTRSSLSDSVLPTPPLSSRGSSPETVTPEDNGNLTATLDSEMDVPGIEPRMHPGGPIELARSCFVSPHSDETVDLTPQEIVRAINARVLKRGKVMVDFCPIKSCDKDGKEIGDVFRVPMHPNVPFSSFELIVDEVIEVGNELFEVAC